MERAGKALELIVNGMFRFGIGEEREFVVCFIDAVTVGVACNLNSDPAENFTIKKYPVCFNSPCTIKGPFNNRAGS